MTTQFAYIFPGQGSQFVGMGACLVDRFPECREVFDEAEATLGIKLTDLMRNGPEPELARTEVAQPAILALSVALFRVCSKRLPPTLAVAGHSLGDFTSLVVAESLGLSAGLQLVRARGELMTQSARLGGGMLALSGPSVSEVREMLAAADMAEMLDVAALNSPSNVVVSGAREAIHAFDARLQDRGIATRQLDVLVPFHSRMLQGAQNGFADVLARVALQLPKVPVVLSVDGAEVCSLPSLREQLVAQITTPVNWLQSVRTLHSLGVRSVIELGPRRTLLSYVRRTAKDIARSAVGGVDDLLQLAEVLTKAEVP